MFTAGARNACGLLCVGVPNLRKQSVGCPHGRRSADFNRVIPASIPFKSGDVGIERAVVWSVLERTVDFGEYASAVEGAVAVMCAEPLTKNYLL